MCVFFFKQKTAYEMRISDWSSDVCSSDLPRQGHGVFESFNDDHRHHRIAAHHVIKTRELAAHAVAPIGAPIAALKLIAPCSAPDAKCRAFANNSWPTPQSLCSSDGCATVRRAHSSASACTCSVPADRKSTRLNSRP